MLDKALLQKLKAEIATDPDGIYAGKTPNEIASLMSSEVRVVEDILYEAPPPPPRVGDKIGERVTVKEAPVWRVIGGTKNGPNGFTAQDVIDALGSP